MIQSNEDGQVRVITTIPDAESEHRFEYVIDDEYSVTEDGTGGLLAYRFVDAPNETGQESFDLVAIKAPWATAADGKEVPTHYEIRGNTIIQVVEPTGDTAYPISADPTWEWYDAAYGAGWNKSETRNLLKYKSASGLCAALSGALKPVCVVGATSWILNTQYAVDRGGCVFYAIAPVPVGLNYDKSKHCR